MSQARHSRYRSKTVALSFFCVRGEAKAGVRVRFRGLDARQIRESLVKLASALKTKRI